MRLTGSDLFCVVTTIQPPTDCVRRLSQALGGVAGRILVIGDRKGPAQFDLPRSEFYSLADQQRLPFKLAPILPAGHYARKNLGYLLAIGRGAPCIYETDDDNMPGDTWQPRQVYTHAHRVHGRSWVNVYRAFTDEHIWPRGFPLERLTEAGGAPVVDLDTSAAEVYAPIQQGLADLAPDVDAVWRLTLDREFYFRPGPSLYLPPGAWCPFNSQTTWWWPVAYPLLYLPTHCSFRMTDIWRGFIAQRLLWELGHGLVFHGPEVIQQRNQHNLLRDFKDEVPGYLNNARLVQRLEDLRLAAGAGAVGDNLIRCYEDLVAGGLFPADELPLVRAWVEDVEQLAAGEGLRVLAA
jgi:hypothetical protein